jgi:hypothetical protein
MVGTRQQPDRSRGMRVKPSNLIVALGVSPRSACDARPVPAGGFCAEPGDRVVFIVSETAIEPIPLRAIGSCALRGQDVGGEADSAQLCRCGTSSNRGESRQSEYAVIEWAALPVAIGR